MGVWFNLWGIFDLQRSNRPPIHRKNEPPDWPEGPFDVWELTDKAPAHTGPHVGRKNIHPAAIREARTMSEKKLCTEPDCLRVSRSRGLCKSHYESQRVAHQRTLVCTQEGCVAARYAKGLCKEHGPRCLYCNDPAKAYLKVCAWHYKKPSWTDRDTHGQVSRVMSNVEKIDKYVPRGLAEDACWPWQGRFNVSTGYGTVYDIDKKTVRNAYSFVYDMFGFDVPAGMQLDHTCRNKACVNPQHLEIVTGTENIRRMTLHWSLYDDCDTEGCTSRGIARGKCAKCYNATRPNFRQGGWKHNVSFEDKIERYIQRHEDGCWDWIGKIVITNNQGTPQLHWNGRTVTAYRAIYMHTKKISLTQKQHLDHLCRNRICVNPDHLEVVTNQENQRRRWEADRARIKQLEEGDEVA